MNIQRAWHLKMMALFWACAGGAVIPPLFHFYLPPLCLFQRFLGIPCPGCGICSSVRALLHGHWLKALTLNPAGPVVLAVCVAMAVYFTYVVFAKPKANFAKEIHVFRLINGFTCCLLFLQWGYKLLNY